MFIYFQTIWSYSLNPVIRISTEMGHGSSLRVLGRIRAQLVWSSITLNWQTLVHVILSHSCPTPIFSDIVACGACGGACASYIGG